MTSITVKIKNLREFRDKIEAARNKIILDNFGHALTPSIVEVLKNGATAIRKAEREYMEVSSERMLYNQCAYGL